MKNVKKESTIVSIMIFAVTLILSVIATYSFFAAQVTGTDASTSVYFATAGQGITITFEGGDQVNLSNIYPRAEAWLEKDITIKSTAISFDVTSIYTFNMVVEENGYHPDDIKYTFTPKTLTGVEAGTSTGTNDLTNLDNKIDIGHGLVKGTSAAEITYTLKVYFVNDPTRNQNTGSAMTAKFYVTYNWGNPVNLTVNLDGGTGLTSTQVAANSELTLPEPRKEGHLFTGWTVNDATVTGNKLTMGTTDATITATYKIATNFELDSWATIAANVANGTALTRYKVGDTREISLKEYTNTETDSDGKYTIRVANNSNYDCTLESKTACGLVVEFQDIITTHRMNPSGKYNGINYKYGHNLGGWPNSELYDYVKTDIYNALPSDLRAVIIDTEVVSGHGPDDSNSSRTDGNWTSTDKLYLLSPTEVWGDCIGATNDTAKCGDYAAQATITRQLDYYANLGVVISYSRYKGAIKQLDGSNQSWSLRSAYSTTNSSFSIVQSNGSLSSYSAYNPYGVAPAFRIG